MKLETYKITVDHDKGIVDFKVVSSSKTQAIAMVMKQEKCPSYAILQANKIKI